MVSPPPVGARRALTAAVWLTITFAGLIGVVWVIGWALSGGGAPSLTSVAEATRLQYPDSTEVVDADLAEMHNPTPGSRGEATLDIPADAFGAFIAGNDMEAPLPSGTTPDGTTTGIIPAGCTDEVCYSATFTVDGAVVTVDITVTLQ